MEFKDRVVFKGVIANELLREGFTIISVKADHINKDKSVFVFKGAEGLNDRLDELVREYKEK